MPCFIFSLVPASRSISERVSSSLLRRCTFRWAASFLLLSVSTAGCGPTVTVQAGPQDRLLPERIAVLPPTDTTNMAREKLMLLENLLVTGLSTRGYLVLDPMYVHEVCPTAATSPGADCPRAQTLRDKYGVDALARLTLETASGANFVAGYYRRIKGQLDIRTFADAPLYTASHTETSSGGLLLESGQVIQAIRSLVQEFKAEERAQNLTQRFMDRLLESLPRRPPGATQPQAPEIGDVQTRPAGSQDSEICVLGTPQMRATLIVQPFKTSLREVTPGKYCTIMSNPLIAMSASSYPEGVFLEIRSPFGLAVRKPLALRPHDICPPPTALTAERQGAKVRLSLSCASDGALPQECSTGSCQTRRFVIYRATSNQGPFSRIAETRTSLWVDDNPPSSKAIYGAVAFGPSASPTRPIITEIKD